MEPHLVDLTDAKARLPLIIKQADEYVNDLFSAKPNSRLIYHNYATSAGIFDNVLWLGQQNNPGTEELEIACLAAWFLYTGYLVDYTQFESESISNAKQFFTKANYPPEKAGRVLLTIKSVNSGNEPEKGAETLLQDAINAHRYGASFFENSSLEQLEIEFLSNQKYSVSDWNLYQMQELLQTRFFSAAAKRTFEPILSANILKQKSKTEKINVKQASIAEKESAASSSKFGPQITDRAVQTFFRSNYRNHINLSAIADNKANIMISVNAILISVIISILSYRNLAESNPMVIMPAVIFLFTGLTSLIFAVLSARPKVTSLIKSRIKPDSFAKKNMVFFGNFVQLEIDEYEKTMEEIFRDGDLLIDNMVRDMYYLGKVLDKKYKFLSISYNIFMVGFAATVILFLITFLSS